MADARTIVEFQIDMALESEGTVLNRETILNGVSEGLSDPAKGTYYLRRTENGQTAGSLFLTKEWSDWNNCNYYWIQSVYVRPESRHQGVFKELFDFAKTIAQSDGAGALRLYVDRYNFSAQKVYQSLGMHESHYLMYEL